VLKREKKKRERRELLTLFSRLFTYPPKPKKKKEGERERENKKDGFFSSAIRITFSSSIRKRESIVHSRSVRHVQQQQ
jgi:hypothetical protein